MKERPILFSGPLVRALLAGNYSLIDGEWFRASETLLAFVNQLRAAA